MLALKGIKLEKFEISAVDEKGERKLEGSYSLMSSADKVLATQGFNGYSDIKISGSPKTKSLIDDLSESIKADLQMVLGFKEGEEGQK